MQVHQGRLDEINIPESQYYLEPEDSSVLELNNDCACALELGKTKVLLYDKNVHEDHGVVLPSATVQISEVSYISITVLPNRNWELILGHTHEIIVELYDRYIKILHNQQF